MDDMKIFKFEDKFEKFVDMNHSKSNSLFST